MQTHVSGVVGVQTVVHTHLQQTQRVTWANDLPSGSGTPAVAFCGIILERTVLYQFGIESAVGRAADVLEEDTDQFVTDHLAPLGSSHGFLGADAHRSCQQCGSKCDTLIHIV